MYLETWSWSSLICAEKVPLQGSCYIELRKNMCFFNIFVLFIVDTTFILKLVFPTVYCFCLDGYFGGCVVAIIVTVVFVFIYLFIWFFVYLFIYLFILPLGLLFLFLLSQLPLLLLLESSLPFMCIWLLLLI